MSTQHFEGLVLVHQIPEGGVVGDVDTRHRAASPEDRKVGQTVIDPDRGPHVESILASVSSIEMLRNRGPWPTSRLRRQPNTLRPSRINRVWLYTFGSSSGRLMGTSWRPLAAGPCQLWKTTCKGRPMASFTVFTHRIVDS